MPRFAVVFLLFLTLIGSTACRADSEAVTILASTAHDARAFTQGLLYYDDSLYESTGKHGSSTLRRVDPSTGEVLAMRHLPARYFGEGLARIDNRLYWLTWKSGVAFVFDAHTLKPIGRRYYQGEGWGLTFDGEHLILSDGSDTLRALEPDDFSVVRRIAVRDDGEPVHNLNELEYVDGEIWANVWFDDHILRIDPKSGSVLGRLDASNLREALPDGSRAEAFNGIAYDSANDRVYVTGKYWPRMFEIQKPDPTCCP